MEIGFSWTHASILFRTALIAVMVLYGIDDGHLSIEKHKLFSQSWLRYRLRKINWLALMYCVFNGYGVVYLFATLLAPESAAGMRSGVVNWASNAATVMLLLFFLFEYRWQQRHIGGKQNKRNGEIAHDDSSG